MPTYVKRPIPVQAWHEFPRFENGRQGQISPAPLRFNTAIGKWQVHDVLHDTWVSFEPGDYIIRGVDGEYYPCKKDVFERTYEASPVLPRQYRIQILTVTRLMAEEFTMDGASPEDVVMQITNSAGVFMPCGTKTTFVPWPQVLKVTVEEVERDTVRDAIREGAV